MPEYKTPLPGIFAAMLESAINRLLELDDDTPSRMELLEGRMLQLDIEDIGITLFFAFNGHRVEVGTRSSYVPDTVISGSPVALFTMAVPDDINGWGNPRSRVKITGDANLARDLERLFSRLDPDWEGRISRIFGDVWGHQIAAGLRAGAEQARDTAQNASSMFSEYMEQNQAPVIRSEELDEFAEAIEETRHSVDLLETRIRRLEKPGE
ncbi:MAG: SCP2 sterol-binding domain-containing protein [Xanthomonadales bacterium]|nr:SCP2 sterol-binding domain-containing protein [Xanthomonadales bacterium]